MRLTKASYAVIFVAVVAGASLAWWFMHRTPDLGRAAYQQTTAILSYGPRPPASPALDAVRKHLRAELEHAGWVTTTQPFEQTTPDGKMTFENVRARYPSGTGDPWSQPVKGVLCAHVDSKLFKDSHFLGADDAASACAAIVEIARYLGKRDRTLAKQLELVFFDGEESIGPHITPTDGLYGSRHYAGFWRSRQDKPTFGILLDMVGHDNLSIRLPSDTPGDLKQRVMAAAKAENAEHYFNSAEAPITDDHVPLNLAGIPTVDLIGDFAKRSWWHTPADNPKIISAKSLGISIRVTLRLLRDW